MHGKNNKSDGDNMKINVIGPIWDSSGYSSHTRQLSLALSKYADVSIETSVPLDWEQQIKDEKLREVILKDNKKEINIFIGQPPFLFTKLGDINKEVIPFVVFEGTNISEQWLTILTDDEINKIFVPSEFLLGLKPFLINVLSINSINGLDLLEKTRPELKQSQPFVLCR